MNSALVTGANQGLGLGFVRHLLNSGWRVFAGTRSLINMPFEHENLVWVELDVSDDESIEKSAVEVGKHTDSLALLINNAGVNKDSVAVNQRDKVIALPALDRTLLTRMFSVNALGPMIVLQKFLPLLTADPAFVVNISSCRASFHDLEGNTNANYGYRGSKVALNMFTLCSLYDLPKNVKTFAVHPGSVKTSMNPDGEQSPEEQAERILSITERWNDSMNGTFLNYDGTPYPL